MHGPTGTASTGACGTIGDHAEEVYMKHSFLLHGLLEDLYILPIASLQ